jgi:hypothetical protein
MQVRALVSAADASRNWDLRCRVREGLIYFLQRQQPDGLPRVRAEIEDAAPVKRRRPLEAPDVAGVGDSSSIRHPEHPGEHAPDAARATDDAITPARASAA